MISELKKKAQLYFNKYIRLRDCDENGYGNCISCGKLIVFGTENFHACHFYNTKNYDAMRYNEENCWGGCKKCNYFMSGNLLEYRKRLVKKIGIERVNELDRLSDSIKKTFTKEGADYYIEIANKYKLKCKELLKQKNF